MIKLATIDEKAAKAVRNQDVFLATKGQLGASLITAKNTLQAIDSIEGKMGRTKQGISLKCDLEKTLTECEKLFEEMNKAYEKDEALYQNKPSKARSRTELDERKKLIGFMKQDLEWVQYESSNRRKSDNNDGRYNLARQLKTRRRKQRERQGDLKSNAPQPLSSDQIIWMTECDERDKKIDSKLDMVAKGLGQLEQIGIDVNMELRKQDKMIENLQVDMDRVHGKLHTETKRMQDLLYASGGPSRWCPIIVTLLVLLGLGSYLYKEFLTK